MKVMKLRTILCCLICSITLTGLYAKDTQSYYYQRANEAYNNDNYDETIRFSELGVQENPKDAYCWALLAEMYSKRAYAQYANALQAADQALKYLPKKAINWRAFIYGIRGNVYYKIGDYAASREAYSQAMKMNPKDEEYTICYADVCYELGDYEEGVRIYKKMMDETGFPAYGYAELAKGYYHLGRPDEAEQACRMAMVLTGDGNYDAHHILARIAIDRGMLATACREEARALALQDQASSPIADTLLYLCHPMMDAAVLNELQKTPMDANQHTHAFSYFYVSADYVRLFYHLLRAEQCGIERKDLSAAYGLAYREMGDYDKAIATIAERMEKDSLTESKLADIYADYHTLYRESGEVDKALEYAFKELAANPDNGDIYRMIGREYIMAGQLEKALLYMDSAVMVADEYMMPTCLFNRAEVHQRMGNEEALRTDCEAALRYRSAANQDRTTFLYAEALLGQHRNLDHYVDSVLALHSFSDVRGSYYDLISCYALLHDKDKVLDLIDRDFRSGQRNVTMQQHYYRLDWLREDTDFRALIAHWDSVRLAELKRIDEILAGDEGETGVTELPFTREGGVCQVKCVINGLPLYFVFDTGAADVTISSVEANFMLKSGYLNETDFMGKQNFVTATGEIHEGTIINLREVRVGDVVLRDVKASVVKSQSAPLLLGQTVFRRFGTLEVDNKAGIIRFRK